MRVGVIMYQTSLTKGQELVAQRMVKELRRQDHEAYLITSVYQDWEPVADVNEVNRRGGYIHSFDETLGIPVVRVNSQAGSWPPRRIAFVDFVANLTRIVDDLKLNVLVTHSTLWNGPEETAKFVEWRRNQIRGGSPVGEVIFCHMSHFQEPSDERYELEERTYREAWNSVSLPSIAKSADLVLVATPYERELMRKLGVEDAKCFLFPGGIDSTVLDFAPRIDFRVKYGLKPERKVVAFLGTLEERKNLGGILKVARSLEGRSDIHFVLAGNLEGEYAASVRDSAAEMKNVSVLGPVPEEDVPALIEESYLNITMSRSEALGLAQLEFMYSGVPVVTSGAGGQSWVVSDNVSGVVLEGPDDVSGAAKAILALVDDPARRNKLGRKAMELASRFTMPKLIHQLSKRISSRIVRRINDDGRALESGERVIEAWIKKGYRVAATTKKLIISSSNGQNMILIPYGEINSVRPGKKFPWSLLALGAALSSVMIALRVMGLPAEAAMTSALTAWASSYSSLLRGLLSAFVPLVPITVSAVAFALGIRRGYSLSYSASKTVFLPGEFSRAVRVADEMTPQSLFPSESLT